MPGAGLEPPGLRLGPPCGASRVGTGRQHQPRPTSSDQTHDLGWKNLLSAKRRSGASATAPPRLDACPRGQRALGFSAAHKLHAINFSGAALAADARLRRAGEEEAFCSRAAVVRAGPGRPAPAAPAEDNEALLEATASLLRAVEECPPATRWTAAAWLKDSSEGCSWLLSPDSGVSPPRGEPPGPPSAGAQDALGLLSPSRPS